MIKLLPLFLLLLFFPYNFCIANDTKSIDKNTTIAKSVMSETSAAAEYSLQLRNESDENYSKLLTLFELLFVIISLVLGFAAYLYVHKVKQDYAEKFQESERIMAEKIRISENRLMWLDEEFRDRRNAFERFMSEVEMKMKYYLNTENSQSAKAFRANNEELSTTKPEDDHINLLKKGKKNLERATKYYKSAKYKKAIKCYAIAFETGLEIAGNSSISAHYSRYAYALSQCRQNDKAIEYYLKSIEFDPTDADVTANVGDLYYIKNDLRNAIHYFKLSVNICKDARLLNIIGNLIGQFESQELALPIYKEAIDLDPALIEPYINIIETCIYIDNASMARNYFDLLLNMESSDPAYRFYVTFFKIILECWEDTYHYNFDIAFEDIKSSVNNNPKVIMLQLYELKRWLKEHPDSSRGKLFLMFFVNEVEDWMESDLANTK